MELTNMNRLIVIISIASLTVSVTAVNIPLHPLLRRPLPLLNPAIKKICDGTEHPAVCASSVARLQNGKTDLASVLEMQVMAGLTVTQNAIRKARRDMSNPFYAKDFVVGSKVPLASCFSVCLENYGSAVDSWKNALKWCKAGASGSSDLANELSAVATYAETCENCFSNDGMDTPTKAPLKKLDGRISYMAGNALQMRAVLYKN